MVSSSLKQFNTSTDRRWVGLFLLIPALLGLITLKIPVYFVMAGLLGLVILAYLFLNPDKTFYLTIFSIPFTERIRVLPISFTVNELMILFTAIVCLFHIIARGHRLSLKTALDPWMAVLFCLFFMTGFFSVSDTGILGFFKIFEAFLFYYMSIYLMRTQQVTRSDILRALIVTAVFQGLLGTFQSVTGMWADFQSERGYLGHLGLGSNHVWHGHGTTGHFNTLGNFLVITLMMLVSLYFRDIKRKKTALIWGGAILLGIITTYSRGSILGLIAGAIFYLAVSQPNLKRSLMMVAAFILFAILPLAYMLTNSSYVETVKYDERLMIWQVPIAAITSSAKAFWFGSGLNSYSTVAWPFIPASIAETEYHNWFAHNFYLLMVVENGIIGATILFTFLVYLWIYAWIQYKRSHGGQKTYSIIVASSMVSLFFVSIFDHTFALPHYKVFIFLLLSLLYVKNTRTNRPA